MTIEHITVFHDQLCITSSKPELNFYKFVLLLQKTISQHIISLYMGVVTTEWTNHASKLHHYTSSPVLDLDMCTLHSCSHSMLYVATGIYTGTQSTTCRPDLAGSA